MKSTTSTTTTTCSLRQLPRITTYVQQQQQQTTTTRNQHYKQQHHLRTAVSQMIIIILFLFLSVTTPTLQALLHPPMTMIHRRQSAATATTRDWKKENACFQRSTSFASTAASFPSWRNSYRFGTRSSSQLQYHNHNNNPGETTRNTTNTTNMNAKTTTTRQEKKETNKNSNMMVPKHVAFICDGNSRWAEQRHLPTAAGHIVGAGRLVDLLETVRQDGIEYCTLYGFSTENWSRPPEEIQAIFRVMEQTARTLAPTVMTPNSITPNDNDNDNDDNENDSALLRIRILGDLQDQRIPIGLRSILEDLQQASSRMDNKDQQEYDDAKEDANGGANGDGPSKKKKNVLTVCVAINYGGRQDILQASQKIAQAIANGDISSSDLITEDMLASYLSTAGIPDPDLIVRTSGECRLSNFLLWNCAYSELYMTPILWPDFDQSCWKDALHWYQQRQRRFGAHRHSPPAPANSATPTPTHKQQQAFNNKNETSSYDHVDEDRHPLPSTTITGGTSKNGTRANKINN
jgi:undecaprenyl diphosphate synthase